MNIEILDIYMQVLSLFYTNLINHLYFMLFLIKLYGELSQRTYTLLSKRNKYNTNVLYK